MSPRRRFRVPVLMLAALAGARVAAAQSSYPTLRPGIFADGSVEYSLSSHATTFSFGEIDPYAEARFSENWSALAELLFQRIERGSSEDQPGKHSVEVDLERLYLAWSRSDALRLQAGEVNSGIIEWNEREQVPRFLQTPVDVPSMARRSEQGGAWPLHMIGAWASGNAPGTAGFRYGAGIGAGRGMTRDDVTFAGAASPAGIASIAFAPAGVPGWTIGGAAFVDRIPAPEGTYREIDETLSTSFVRGALELRGEWGRMEHRLDGVTHLTTGWYALASWRLGGALESLRPYALLDRLDVANEEPYLSDVPDQRAWSAGVRWDAASHLVFKFDYQSQRAPHAEEERRARVQVAVAF
ncbi:MAG TPA: hypothetical protein VFS34_09160 [Thermoanaerobaculia bacterium]|nr:hypothetical protein [Thermoanaerobaculia bacterium]